MKQLQHRKKVNRVIIVDGRSDMRMLVRARLEMADDIEVVGEACNGREALTLVAALAPAAAVIDLDMSVMHGEEAIPLMRELAPGMRIVVFSESEQAAKLREESAPDAVVTKGQPLDGLVTQLHELLAMGPYDVMRLNLGSIPLRKASKAFDSWVVLNTRVLDALVHGDKLVLNQLSGATLEELQALMGIYAHIGHCLQGAARQGLANTELIMHLLRTTGVAARGALLAFNHVHLPDFYAAWNYHLPESAADALQLTRDRLMDALPVSTGGGTIITGVFRPRTAPATTETVDTERQRAAVARDQMARDRDEVSEYHSATCESFDEDLLNSASQSPVDAVIAAVQHHREDCEASAEDRIAARSDREAAADDREALSIDDLTGTYRRGPGFVELERDLLRARRTNQPLVFAFVDVDGLKIINDTQGHRAGDRLLREVVDAIRAELRDYDVIVRYGGDEFLCSMPAVSKEEAALRLKRVNETLAASPDGWTVSAGIAQLEADDDLESLVARADDALYRNHTAKALTPSQATSSTTAS